MSGGFPIQPRSLADVWSCPTCSASVLVLGAARYCSEACREEGRKRWRKEHYPQREREAEEAAVWPAKWAGPLVPNFRTGRAGPA
jgi:hypothetical protein